MRAPGNSWINAPTCHRFKQRSNKMTHNSSNDGFFKIDPECHIIGDMEPVNHFPGVQMWWKSIDGIMRPLMQGAPADTMKELEPWEMQKSTDPENILRAM